MAKKDKAVYVKVNTPVPVLRDGLKTPRWAVSNEWLVANDPKGTVHCHIIDMDKTEVPAAVSNFIKKYSIAARAYCDERPEPAHPIPAGLDVALLPAIPITSVEYPVHQADAHKELAPDEYTGASNPGPGFSDNLIGKWIHYCLRCSTYLLPVIDPALRTPAGESGPEQNQDPAPGASPPAQPHATCAPAPIQVPALAPAPVPAPARPLVPARPVPIPNAVRPTSAAKPLAHPPAPASMPMAAPLVPPSQQYLPTLAVAPPVAVLDETKQKQLDVLLPYSNPKIDISAPLGSHPMLPPQPAASTSSTVDNTGVPPKKQRGRSPKPKTAEELAKAEKAAARKAVREAKKAAKQARALPKNR